jgi:hypothetical protein
MILLIKCPKKDVNSVRHNYNENKTADRYTNDDRLIHTGIVDSNWKEIMTATVKDPHVLAATTQPGMLEKLRDGFRLLEDIQKGLNNYLEKKRLFFPR